MVITFGECWRRLSVVVRGGPWWGPLFFILLLPTAHPLFVSVAASTPARPTQLGVAGSGLDADERRFKRRLEQQMQEIDDIFETDGEGEDDDDDEHTLDADDIEQLQLLEAELAKKGAWRPLDYSIGRTAPLLLFDTTRDTPPPPQPTRPSFSCM